MFLKGLIMFLNQDDVVEEDDHVDDNDLKIILMVPPHRLPAFEMC